MKPTIGEIKAGNARFHALSQADPYAALIFYFISS